VDKKTYISILDHIVEALLERGYNPYAQLKGYLINNSELYITSFKKARDMIKTIDVKDVENYIHNWDEYQDKKWHIEFISMSK